jgi:hypothetical protein
MRDNGMTLAMAATTHNDEESTPEGGDLVVTPAMLEAGAEIIYRCFSCWTNYGSSAA